MTMKRDIMDSYSTINSKKWSEILCKNHVYTWQPPVTVHLPLQPIHSPDLVHLDAALNVSRRRVIKDLPLKGYWDAMTHHETFLVQFALDDQPFVPDWRYSKLSLEEGRYPIARVQYFAWDILYEFTYTCCPVDEEQSLLWIDVSLSNESPVKQSGHVRTKVDFQYEADVFDYHYVPFWWDAKKWLPCEKVHLNGLDIYRQDTLFGRCVPGDFSCQWETESHFQDDQYRQMGMGSAPTHNMRILDVYNVIHFQVEIEPGERKNFSLAFLVNYENVNENHVAFLKQAAKETACQRALAKFKEPFSDQKTKLWFTSSSWEDIFVALQLSSLQLMIKFADEQWLKPTQGGSSERHFVWVWEAVCMLRPLLWLGHFEQVKRALLYLFSLQDAGCPPEGKFTSLEGAIGTTGPKWMNSTGSALGLAAEYYLYTRDESFIKEYLPRILAAASWNIKEIRATRKLNPDGSRPLYYGLMPFGCATDGDIGYIVAFTDTYTYWGLKKTVQLLEVLGHEKAQEFRHEVDQYAHDIQTAIKGLTRPDGYIERKIVTQDDGTVHSAKFENIAGAIHFVYTDLLDPQSETFKRYMAYFERHCADGAFLGMMDRDVAYMGIGEWLWQDAYLKCGEWKKAFLATETNLKFGMTQDTYQVQERFSRFNPAFTPWQPNGSGNGKILEMMLKSIYFEIGDTALLLGGIPWVWLQESGSLTLKNLYTPHGRISVTVNQKTQESLILKLTFHDQANWLKRIRIPDFFHAQSDDPCITKVSDLEFDISCCIGEISLVLTESEKCSKKASS